MYSYSRTKWYEYLKSLTETKSEKILVETPIKNKRGRYETRVEYFGYNNVGCRLTKEESLEEALRNIAGSLYQEFKTPFNIEGYS